MIRKIFIKYIFTILAITYISSGFSQNFSESESIKTGSKEFDKENYLAALPHYQYLLSLYPNNLEYNFKYGACLVYKKDINTALKHLRFCEKQNYSNPQVYFYLGKANHLSYSFNTAIGYYNTFKNKADTKEQEKFEVDNEIKKCQDAKTLLRNYSELKVNKKQKASAKDFYRYYNIKNLGGRIIIADEFQSKADKKLNHHPVIYLQNNNKYIFYGSYGDNGKDIYMRRRTDNGEWSDPVLLPSQVNTKYDEDYAYLSSDGQTLYFSSKGHTGLGGYDIFKVTYNPETNEASTPINLDFKINSPDDDLFYIDDPNDDRAYFASSRETDINSVNVYDIGITSYPMQNILIAGQVTGEFNTSETSLKVEATNDGNKLVDKAYLNNDQENFLLTLPKGGKYTFSVTSKVSKLKVDATVDVPFIIDLTPLKIIVDYKIVNDIENITIIKRFNEGVGNKDEIIASYYRKIANPEVNPDFDPQANEESYDKSFVSKKVNALIEQKEKEQLKLKGQLYFAKENAQKEIQEALKNQEKAEQALANKDYDGAQEFQVKADNNYLNSKSYSNNASKISEIIANNDKILTKANSYKSGVDGFDNSKLQEVTKFVNANQEENIIASVFQKEFQQKEDDLSAAKKTLNAYNLSVSDLESQIKANETKLAQTSKKRDKEALESQLSTQKSELATLKQAQISAEEKVKDLQDEVNQSSNDVLISGQVAAAEPTAKTSSVSESDLAAKQSEYKQSANLIVEQLEENGVELADNTNTNNNTSNENNATENNSTENNTTENNTSENTNNTQENSSNTNTTPTVNKNDEIKKEIDDLASKSEQKIIQQQKHANFIYSKAQSTYNELKSVEKQIDKEKDDAKLTELIKKRKELTIKTINYAKLLNDYQADIANQVDNLTVGKTLSRNGVNDANQEKALRYLETEKYRKTPTELVEEKLDKKQNELIDTKKQLELSNKEITRANEKLDELGRKLNSQANLSSEEKENIVAEITEANRRINDISLAQKAYYNHSNSIQNQLIGLLDQQELVEYIENNASSTEVTSAKDNSSSFDKLKEDIANNVSDEYTKDAGDVLNNESFDINSEIVFLTKMEWVQTTYKNLVSELDEIGKQMENTPKTDRKYADLKNKAWVTQNRFFEKNFDTQLKFFEAKSEVAVNIDGVTNNKGIEAKHKAIADKAKNLFNQAKNTVRLDEKNELYKKAFTVLTLQDNELDSIYDESTVNEYGIYVDKSKEALEQDVKRLQGEYEGLNNEIFQLTKQFENEKDETKRGQILKIKVKKEILARNKLKLINDIKKLIEDKSKKENFVASSEAEQQFYDSKKEREELLFEYINNTEWEDQAEMEKIKAQYEEISQITKEIEELYAQLKVSESLATQEEIKAKIEGLNEKLNNKENNLFVKMINTNYSSISAKNNEIKEKLEGYSPDNSTAKRLEDLQKALQEQIRKIDSLKAIRTDDPRENALIKREIFKTQSTIIDLQNQVITEINNNPSVSSGGTQTVDGTSDGQYTGTNTTLNSSLSNLVDEEDLEDYDISKPIDSKDLNILKNLNTNDEEYAAFLKEINVLIGKIDAAQKGSAEYLRLKQELVNLENEFLTNHFYDRYESFSVKATSSPVAKNAFSASKIEMIKHDAEEQFLDAKNATDLAIKNNILKQAFIYVTKYEAVIDSIERANQDKKVSEYKKLSNNTLDFNIGNLQQDIFNLMNQVNDLLEKYNKETDPFKKQQLLREKKQKEVAMELKKLELSELTQILDERNGIVTPKEPEDRYTPTASNDNKEIKAEIAQIQEKTAKQIEELKGIQTELADANEKQQALLDEIGRTDDPDKKKELYDEYQDLKAMIEALQKKLAAIQAEMDKSSKRLSELQEQLKNGGNNGNILLPSGVSNDPASFVSVNFVNQFSATSGADVTPRADNQKNIPGLVYKVQIGAFYNQVPETNFDEYSPITFLQVPGSKYVRYYAGKFSQFGIANQAKNVIRGKSKYSDAFVVAFYNGQKININKARQLENGNADVKAELDRLTLNNTNNQNNGNGGTVNTNNNTNSFNNNTGNNTNTNTNNSNNNNNTNTNTNNNNSTANNNTSTSNQGIPNSLFFTVQIGALSTPVPNGTYAGISEVFNVNLSNGFIRYNSGKFNSAAAANSRLNEVQNTIRDAFVVAYYNGKKITVSKANLLINQYGNDILIK